MKRNNIFVFIALNCFFLRAAAQERIVHLNANPILMEKYKEKQVVRSANALNTFWIHEPINVLPFQDDFSRTKNTDYNPDHYPAAAKSDSVWNSYKINGATPPIGESYFMRDTSYTYTFNSATNTVTRVANAPFTLTFFQNKLAPNVITLTKEFWPIYDSIRFNPTTNLPDTFAIAPDTMVVGITDTLYYVRVASGKSNWKNSNVFWNDTYPVNPPSIGVVTFDGIDSTGYPYNFNIATAQGKADVLNSVPFDLSAFSPVNDSIFFSFYYQSTGRGNKPEPEDSIKLEFKTKEGTWNRVWGKEGYALTSDSVFSRKVIAIKDSAYFHKNFEFRFTNYATLSGSLDHWHIDYVRIDLDNDTINKDITWVYPGKSLFKLYQQIPRKQYTGASADYFKNYVRNLFNQTINVTYELRVRDYFTNTLFSIDVNNVDFTPLNLNSCSFCNQILNPLAVSTFSFPQTSQCARYEVKGLIQNIANEPNLDNDTLYYTQIFGDCFAYDDGTAEAAYGINSQFAQMAVKFTANLSDTLKALRIFFNPVVVNASQTNFFTIVVWTRDSNGKPGNEIHRNTLSYAPIYNGTMNGFVDYLLDAPIIVSGDFFVGIEQFGASELNVGLDRNTNAMEQQYYQSTGTWFLTQFKGSWMMRPVFGACQDFLSGVNKIESVDNISLYPNPTDALINFSMPDDDAYMLNLMDARGQLLYEAAIKNNSILDISSLSDGIYVALLRNALSGKVFSRKIIRSKN
jgi:hypothetical protein